MRRGSDKGAKLHTSGQRGKAAHPAQTRMARTHTHPETPSPEHTYIGSQHLRRGLKPCKRTALARLPHALTWTAQIRMYGHRADSLNQSTPRQPECNLLLNISTAAIPPAKPVPPPRAGRARANACLGYNHPTSQLTACEREEGLMCGGREAQHARDAH